ncbi:MAG: hypothetical protein IT183_14235 [Acidobacteria bacterium]|nr:hypothetical protein [Acidobacteriota bacterium]
MRLLSSHGVDLLQGVGANRSAIASEQVPVVFASTSIAPVVDEHEQLRLIVDSNFVPGAQLTIELTFTPA